jgi:hypothetical protein
MVKPFHGFDFLLMLTFNLALVEPLRDLNIYETIPWFGYV